MDSMPEVKGAYLPENSESAALSVLIDYSEYQGISLYHKKQLEINCVQSLSIFPKECSDAMENSIFLNVCKKCRVRCTFVLSAHIAEPFFEQFSSKNSFISHIRACIQSVFTSKISSFQLFIFWPNYMKICFGWVCRVDRLVRQKIMMEDAMNWLSTLGGGYSCLGEQSTFFAEHAGRISVQQLALALEMADPHMVARCHLYWAQSLMQRGHLRQATSIIREKYGWAVTAGRADPRLALMCRGLWARLQFLVHQRRGQRGRSSTSGASTG